MSRGFRGKVVCYTLLHETRRLLIFVQIFAIVVSPIRWRLLRDDAYDNGSVVNNTPKA